jgi:hypothetical protein
MSLSNKILMAIISMLIICFGGFLVYKQIETAQRLDEIQKSVVETKQLVDNISRAQAQYASKEDIDAFAKQQNINIDAIKKDLETLNAEVKAIAGVTVVSRGQSGKEVPSTSVTPRPSPGTVDEKTDPYGYMRNTQHFALTEKFSNVEVPFGTVGFSAWKEKPWEFNVPERKYSVTSVLGQDENGRHYSYSKFAIKSSGKTYDVKIDDNKFLEEYPKEKFHWLNPRLYMFANGGVGISQVPVKGEFTPGIAVGIMSYGKTRTNPSLSILHVGVGYGVINKTLEVSVSPLQYNLGNVLPLVKNTYVGPTIQINTQGNVTPGAGLSVGF